MIDLFKSRFKWILIGTVTVTFFFTIFGERGLMRIFRIRKEITRIKASKIQFEAKNKQLEEDVLRMKHEKGYQERSARETLGFAKDNEMIYEFPE